MRLFTCAYTPSFPDGVDECRKFTQNPHFEVFSSKVSENRSKISLHVTTCKFKKLPSDGE